MFGTSRPVCTLSSGQKQNKVKHLNDLKLILHQRVRKNIWCVARHIKKFDKRGIEMFILAKNSSRTFRLQVLPSSARIKNANV